MNKKESEAIDEFYKKHHINTQKKEVNNALNRGNLGNENNDYSNIYGKPFSNSFNGTQQNH